MGHRVRTYIYIYIYNIHGSYRHDVSHDTVITIINLVLTNRTAGTTRHKALESEIKRNCTAVMFLILAI